jgi:hypothetical protein
VSTTLATPRSRKPSTFELPASATWLITITAFVALAGLQLIRQSGVESWKTVWAEDGSVYFRQTTSIGHLFDGYAGYLQLIPRMLGLLANQLPIADVAVFFAIAGACVTALAALAVWHFSAQLVPTRVLRAVLVLNRQRRELDLGGAVRRLVGARVPPPAPSRRRPRRDDGLLRGSLQCPGAPVSPACSTRSVATP